MRTQRRVSERPDNPPGQRWEAAHRLPAMSRQESHHGQQLQKLQYAVHDGGNDDGGGGGNNGFALRRWCWGSSGFRHITSSPAFLSLILGILGVVQTSKATIRRAGRDGDRGGSSAADRVISGDWHISDFNSICVRDDDGIAVVVLEALDGDAIDGFQDVGP